MYVYILGFRFAGPERKLALKVDTAALKSCSFIHTRWMLFLLGRISSRRVDARSIPFLAISSVEASSIT